MQHVLTNALFELDSDVAYGEVYMAVRTAGADTPPAPESFGRNLDRYERRDGVWRIAQRRVIIEQHDRKAADHARFIVGRNDPLDPSYRHSESTS